MVHKLLVNQNNTNGLKELKSSKQKECFEVKPGITKQ